MLYIVYFTILVSATATFLAVVLAFFLSLGMNLQKFRFSQYALLVAQSLNAVPPTVIGVFFYFCCTNVDGFAALLFTPYGMIIGQLILGLPIGYVLFSTLISRSLDKVRHIVLRDVMGVQRLRNIVIVFVVLWDIRNKIVSNAFIIFGRLVGEVGAILIIGGGIIEKTETLSTNIVMQTQMGEVESALKSGIMLLFIVIFARLFVYIFESRVE